MQPPTPRGEDVEGQKKKNETGKREKREEFTEREELNTVE